MLKALAGSMITAGLLAQEPPAELNEVLTELAVPTEQVDVAARIPEERRRWARELSSMMTARERAALFERQLGSDPASQAICIRLIELGDEVSGDARLAQARAYWWLANLEQRVAIRRGFGASIEDWVDQVAEPARQRGNAVAAAMLRDDPASPGSLRLLAGFARSLCKDDRNVRLREWALARLDDQATPTDHGGLARAYLQLHRFDDALRCIDLARKARSRTGMFAQESVVLGLDRLATRVQRARRLRTAVDRSPQDLVTALQLASASGSDDTETLCAELVEADVQHAFPFTLQAGLSLAGGDRDTARPLLDKAVDRPGANAATGALLLFANLDKLQKSAASPAAVLQQEALLSRVDDLFERDPMPTTDLLLCMREAGWPASAVDDQREAIARLFAGDASVPPLVEAHYLALASYVADGNTELVMKFLRRPLPDNLQRYPLLARRRAQVATLLGIGDDDANDEALVDELWRACDAFGDQTFVRYLRLVRAWSDADDEAARREVLASLRLLQPLAIDPEAFPFASGVATLSAMLDGDYDHKELVRVRTLSNAAGSDDNLVPLACGLLAGKGVARGLQLARFLRDRVKAPGMRLTLLRAQAAAMHRIGENDRAAAFATQALRDQEWPQQADLRMHGILPTNDLQWGMFFSATGFRFNARFDLAPYLIPKLPGRPELRRIAKKQ